MAISHQEDIKETVKTGVLGFGTAFTAHYDIAASEWLKQQANFSQNAPITMGYETILNNDIWLEETDPLGR